MASVTLTEVWLNLKTDDSQTRSFAYVSSFTSQPAMAISSAVYADGNARMSWVIGYQAKVTVTLLAVSGTDRRLFEFPAAAGGWLGELVWFRDDRGRKFCGYFDPPQITEHGYNSECDVQLAFTQVFVDDLL